MIKYQNMPKLFWFTGQSGAGKTELANTLKIQLNREQTIVQQNILPQKIWSDYIPNKKFVIIDDDDINKIFITCFSGDREKENVDSVQKLCVFLIENNIVPIVCMVSPFAEQRKKFIEENNGLEIYVHCNEIRGREKYHVDYYEPPIESENTINIDTTEKSVSQSFKELWENIF